MTTDLRYLACTAILTADLWIPSVVAQVTTNGFLAPPNYVDPTPDLAPPWGTRADVRTLVFTLGFISVAGIFWEVIK